MEISEFNNKIAQALENEEGTFTTNIERGNFFDSDSDNLFFIDTESKSGNAFLKIFRDTDFNLVAEYGRLDQGVKKCSLDISDIENSEKLFVGFSWSSDEIGLFVGPDKRKYPDKDLRNASASENIAKIRKDGSGELVIIGDEGLDVGYFEIRRDARKTLEPNAEELIEFQIERAKIVLSISKEGDFLAESTLVQQAVVILVTAWETFLERKLPDLYQTKKISEEKLFDLAENEINMNRSEIENKANESDKSLERYIAQRPEFNFQDVGKASRIYRKLFDINIEKFLSENNYYEFLARLIDLRHRIIHEANDNTILNIDKIDREDVDPRFTNKRYGEKCVEDFEELVEVFQDHIDDSNRT